MKIDMGHIVLGGVVVGMYLHQRKRTAQSAAREVCTGVDDQQQVNDKKPNDVVIRYGNYYII